MSNQNSEQQRNQIDRGTIIITGANRGIGFEAALELAKQGFRIILACRDVQGGNEAKEKIIRESQNADIVLKKLDLSSFKSIRSFASEIIAEEERVKMLINNAGVLVNNYRITEDGFETTFGVNHLGHFLLTNLLLDLLKRSAPSRIINVSSIGHRFGHIHWDDLNMKENFNGVHAYSQSKLMNVLFSFELSKRLSGSGVSSFSLHPGAINTDIYRESQGCCKLGGCIGFWISLVAMMRSCMAPASKGAETIVHCATIPSPESVSGRYFSDCKVKRESPKGRDPEAAKRLWDLSMELTNLNSSAQESNGF